MQDEKFIGCHCDETMKITKDKGDNDVTQYKAVFRKENGDDWVKIVMTSNQVLKSLQGEVVDFIKTRCQSKLDEFHLPEPQDEKLVTEGEKEEIAE